MKQDSFFDVENVENETFSKITNVASVPQLSVFRYPGGKTWFIPRLREWLKSQKIKPKVFIEPFVGGGICSLTSVSENLCDMALMGDLDEEVGAVWQAILSSDADWLAEKILLFEMNYENVSNVIKKDSCSVKDRAFKTILKNRCSHGGILASGAGFLRKGESGKGILSRWYPDTLAKRIKVIHLLRNNLEFRLVDAFDILDEFKSRDDVVFFIDPPYTVGGKRAGKRLYTHHELDHDLLFKKCAELRGDFIMTYDNADEVKNLVKKYNFEAMPIPMKNTHHAKMTELVIGRNLEWINEINRFLKRQALQKVKKV